MRECGECTLCCKLPRIPDLNKASNTWCRHCANGCMIYESRPKVCKDFTCQWLQGRGDERPDTVHFYVSGDCGEEVMKVIVDPDYPGAWQGSPTVDWFLESHHLLVVTGRSMTFLASYSRLAPEKLIVEWLL